MKKHESITAYAETINTIINYVDNSESISLEESDASPFGDSAVFKFWDDETETYISITIEIQGMATVISWDSKSRMPHELSEADNLRIKGFAEWVQLCLWQKKVGNWPILKHSLNLKQEADQPWPSDIVDDIVSPLLKMAESHFNIELVEGDDSPNMVRYELEDKVFSVGSTLYVEVDETGELSVEHTDKDTDEIEDLMVALEKWSNLWEFFHVVEVAVKLYNKNRLA